jgi:8-oxo-dGTP pyrophosphatase MutT (NUDIX family)
MSVNQSQSPTPASPASPSPNIKAVVIVSTASAIIRSSTDPYKILVATSAKHSKPVIPGGKVEREDIHSDGRTPGSSCVRREVLEEIGVDLANLEYIGKAVDPERDIRLVPPSKLATTLVHPPLPADLPSDATIKAHYGCPDYIFVGTVDENSVAESEELKNLRFINIREIGLGDLSAGHDIIVLWYRRMLDNGETQLPTHALRRFDEDGKGFAFTPVNQEPKNSALRG